MAGVFLVILEYDSQASEVLDDEPNAQKKLMLAPHAASVSVDYPDC